MVDHRSQHSRVSIVESSQPTQETENEKASFVMREMKSLPRELLPMKSALKPSLKPSLKQRKKEELSISTITADDQSIVSTLSRSTFHSNASSITISAFLVDASIDPDEEGNESILDHCSVHEEEKNSESTTPKAEKARPFENTLDRMFLHLYDAIIDNETMEISCGDDNDAVQGFSTPEKVKNEFSGFWKTSFLLFFSSF